VTNQLLFTIGHSNHAIRRFVDLLAMHRVALVCDVRSSPYSRFNPQFNREPLRTALEACGIAYLFLGGELGGKPRGDEYPTDDQARFALIAGSQAFRAGLARLLEEAASHRTAIMCAEKEPEMCHRSLLICPHLPAGVAVHHILADGSVREHGEQVAGSRADDGDQPRLF